MTTIAKNITASGIVVPDMSGLYIPPYGQVNLRDFFSIDEIEWSLDLKSAIESNIIILNNGIKDLSKQDSLDHQTLDTRFEVPHLFVELEDTPDTLSGVENLYVRVQSTASGNRLAADYADATYIKGVYVEDSEIEDGYLLRYDALEDHLHYESIGTILDVYGIFGSYFTQATDETTSSTTGTTWVEKLSLTVSGLPPGIYRVAWYYEWQMDNSSFNFMAQIQINDTDTIMEHTERPSDSSSWGANTGFYYQTNTVSGTTYFIDLDFAASTPGKQASIRRARMSVWRVE